MPSEHILIVDDERNVAESILQMLTFEGYTADVATNLSETEALLEKRIYDAAIVDLRMPDVSGITVVARCREIDPAIALLMLTAYGTVEATRQAFKLGIKDFLTKPISRETLCAALENALDTSRLQREYRDLKQRLQSTASFTALVGRSASLRAALDLAARVAASDLPVLICGETGTGKELVAAAIHNSSARSERLMVTANLAAIPEQLCESVLFGHTKGSFTGAVASHRGFFKEADKSTLFLDEFTEVSPHVQAALLRALEEKKVRAVGSDHEISVDVRIICATNRNVNEEITRGSFRADLYHRIAGMKIELPSLRERREDIPLLATHFVSRSVGGARPIPEIEPEALERLISYDWPGNVRELKNVIERAVLLSGADTIRVAHCVTEGAFNGQQAPDGCYDLSLKAAQDSFVSEYLRRLLTRYGNDTQKVADHAGTHVTTIRRLIRELGLK